MIGQMHAGYQVAARTLEHKNNKVSARGPPPAWARIHHVNWKLPYRGTERNTCQQGHRRKHRNRQRMKSAPGDTV
jgi:hypothetical protein